MCHWSPIDLAQTLYISCPTQKPVFQECMFWIKWTCVSRIAVKLHQFSLGTAESYSKIFEAWKIEVWSRLYSTVCPLLEWHKCLTFSRQTWKFLIKWRHYGKRKHWDFLFFFYMPTSVKGKTGVNEGPSQKIRSSSHHFKRSHFVNDVHIKIYVRKLLICNFSAKEHLLIRFQVSIVSFSFHQHSSGRAWAALLGGLRLHLFAWLGKCCLGSCNGTQSPSLISVVM